MEVSLADLRFNQEKGLSCVKNLKPTVQILAFSLLIHAQSSVFALPPGEQIEIDPPSTEGFLSPPRMVRPIYFCSEVVGVEGAVPFGMIVVEGELSGSPYSSGPVPADVSGRASITLPQGIGPGDWFHARQEDGTDVSDYDYPAGAPETMAVEPPAEAPIPAIYWEEFLSCGRRVGATSFLSGSYVEVSVHNSDGSKSHDLFRSTTWFGMRWKVPESMGRSSRKADVKNVLPLLPGRAISARGGVANDA